MKTAWAVSIVAQIMLLASLLRAGRRDAWTAYLGLDLARSFALVIAESGSAYWWTWMAFAAPWLYLQLHAAAEATNGVKLRETLHIGIIAGASCWMYSILLSGPSWPTARRAPLMLAQGAAFGCLGCLAAPLAYGEQTDKWMLIYYIAQSIYMIVGQITVLDAQWNSLHLWVVAAVFAVWAYQQIKRELWAN